MAANQPPWPREWLMTDERLGERLWQAIEALPPGAAGVVFRHYATEANTRRQLALRVAEIGHRRGLVLAMARDAGLAKETGAQLVHNPAHERAGLPFTRSAHSMEEAAMACAQGAALVFVSPVHPTRSHPGQKPLGESLALRIANACPVPAIALGGVNRSNFERLQRGGFYGWAGIDAWLGEQIRI